MPAWQSNCAFVPQSIHLLDGSIRDNVAFGCDAESIDDDKVWAALEASQFDEFVAGMAYGLYTMIGENGLSFQEVSASDYLLHVLFIEELKC